MASKNLKATFRELDIPTVEVNDYNANELSPRAYRKLVEEIEENGFLSGILVYGEGDRFIVVDGEHRFLAGREAGLKKVPAFVLSRKPTRAEAMKLTLKMNSIRGKWEREKLKENMAELLDVEDVEALTVDLAGLDDSLDRVLKEADKAGLDEKTQEDMKTIERELKLSERVKALIRRALIEGQGSIVKNYLAVIDRNTGKEMFFLFETEAEPVRRAIEAEAGSGAEGFDSHVLSRICERSLSAGVKGEREADGLPGDGG